MMIILCIEIKMTKETYRILQGSQKAKFIDFKVSQYILQI